jgi:predicted oxidoreductase
LVAFGNDSITSVELFLGAAKAFGGAELDTEARVLDANGEIIDGLWAAGEAAGMLGTPAVGGGFSGSVAACYLTGQVAGQNAAAAALAD